jgi:hypothetical protein
MLLAQLAGESLESAILPGGHQVINRWASGGDDVDDLVEIEKIALVFGLGRKVEI